MSTIKMSVRVPEDLVAWMDEYRVGMRWQRSTLLLAALESFREDVGGGVPDLPPAVASGAEQAERSVPAPKDRVPDVPGVVRGSEVPWPKPSRTSFDSGEEWQNAVRLWKAREG